MSIALENRVKNLELAMLQGVTPSVEAVVDLCDQVRLLSERVHRLEGELRAMKARMGKIKEPA